MFMAQQIPKYDQSLTITQRSTNASDSLTLAISLSER
jgi:hypothetical protein